MDPERINIKDLTIEEPEKQAELPFDPEEDITEEDWISMKNTLEDFGDSKDKLFAFALHASQMKVIDPSFEIKINDKTRQKLEEQLQMKRHFKNWGDFSRFVAALKIVDPNYKPDITKDDWMGIGQELEGHRSRKHVWHFFDHALTMKIIDPKFDIQLNNDLREIVNQQIKTGKMDPSLAVDLKLFEPDLDLELNSHYWELMHKKLADERDKKTWHYFSKQAMLMKILAAEKIEIDNQGLKITMPGEKRFLEGESFIPETRKF